MKWRELNKLEAELDEYMKSLFDGMGREERRRALGWYLTGLLLDDDRKSIDPLDARLAESDAERGAMRQRLQQAVCVASWSDDELYRRLAVRFERDLPGLEAFVIDDTGFPKKGTHSVGVTRQYSGTLGRTDNCQVAVSLHLAGEKGSGCIGFRLFLPDEWTQAPERCRSAGVPEDIVFEKKWEFALGSSIRHSPSAPESISFWPVLGTATRATSETRSPSEVWRASLRFREAILCGRRGATRSCLRV